MLGRNGGRVRYELADRMWFDALARLLPRRRWTGIFPVTPATVLAWHRKLAAKRYDTSRRRKARPPADRPEHHPPCRSAGAAEPAVGISPDPRRTDKLGVTVAPSTVWKTCVPRASTRRRAAWTQPGGSFCTPRQPGSSRSTSCTWIPCCSSDCTSWCYRARQPPDASGRRHRGSNFTHSFDAVFEATGETCRSRAESYFRAGQVRQPGQRRKPEPVGMIPPRRPLS